MADRDRLAVTELAMASYRYLVANSDTAWRIAGLWGVVIVAAELLTGMVDPETTAPGMMLAALVLGLTANLVLLPTVMVGWYRHVLLGELPDGPAPPITVRTFRTVGYSILVGVIIALPIIAVIALIWSLLGEAGMALAMVGGVIAAVLLSMRFVLLFPSIAVDDPHIGLGGAWTLSEGEAGSLFLGAVLVTLPVGVAIVLLELTGSLALQLVAAVLIIVQLLLLTTFVAMAFRELRDRRERLPAPDDAEA
jgi:hypothetical protein